MILYDYYRSSASYRIRIALNLKSLSYRQLPVNLVAAEQSKTAHQQLNTQQLVPVLVDGDTNLTQSLAICEYLDEAYPQSFALITGNPKQRCVIRAFALAIACEIHPVNNLRVLKYLQADMKVDEASKTQWYQHWVNTTFTALERQLSQRTNTSPFCFGDQPTLADVCLIPQIYNAKRFEVDMSQYPLLLDIDRNCQAIDAFAKAHPDYLPKIKIPLK
ncbi:MAG: maleylacetoacetate isomerase [Oceanospirillaceae bacterium]|nr:maleylacetoacetate isomerase [Oceanospirillaceae bacterium]